MSIFRNIGSISKRFGYYKTSALGSGYDSLFGLFGMYLSDGTKRIVFAADSAGVGYGGLYVGSSSFGRIDTLTTKIAKYWSQVRPRLQCLMTDYTLPVRYKKEWCGMVSRRGVIRSTHRVNHKSIRLAQTVGLMF
jgi:hypothetical protein